MNTASDIWKKAQEQLLAKLGQETFERYLGDVQAMAYGEGTGLLTLATSSAFMMHWLKSNYSDLLRSAVVSAGAADFELVARDASPAPAPAPATGKAARAPRHRPAAAPDTSTPPPLSTPWRPDLTFDNFVIGNSNRIPVAAARHVAQNPGKSYNPLFIYGGVGLGKTHLLTAIANEIHALRTRARVEYLTSEDFVNRYVEALQNKTLPAFRQHFRSLDLLLIDDVQFFEGKVGTSEEFFHTFNTLQNNHKQIVLASDRTPKELNGLASRLLSRFEGGLSAEILPPSEVETRMAILRKKQEAQNIKLPDPVLALIAERIRSNIRNLEGALTRLVMHVSIFGQEMSPALASELLRDKFETEQGRVLTAALIQRAVSDYFQVSVPDLLGPRRPKQIAQARMVAMYLARSLTTDSLPGIGRAFNRDHATVVHAVNAITSRLDTDDSLRTAVNTLTRQLQPQ